MTTRRALLQSASALTLGVPLLARSQPSYKTEYRISMASPPGTVWHQGTELFARLVQEKTQGRIRMKNYPGASLVQGKADRELVALREGVIDVLTGTTVTWSGTVKEFALFHLPFLMPTSKAVDAVLASEVLNKDFYDIMRRAGFEPLASSDYGAFQLFNSKRRVVTPDDIEGLKIRTVSTPMQQEIMTAYGANPTTMSFADLQAALASGAVDGLMITVEQSLALKLHTLGLKYITKWNAHNELLHIAVANPVWRSWTDEDRKIVGAAAKEAAADMRLKVRTAQASENAALKAVGTEVIEPTPAQALMWHTNARRVYARWKATIGPDLVTKVEQVVDAASKA